MIGNGNGSKGFRRFFVSTMDNGHQEVICCVARDDCADIQRRSVWGVTFECDRKTAKRILGRAGRYAAELDALRADALAYILEKAISCSPELDEEDVLKWDVKESDASTTGPGVLTVGR